MSGQPKPRGRRLLRRLVLAAGGVGLLAGGLLAYRGHVVPWARGQSAASAPAASPQASATAPAATGDYAQRVVAYLNDNVAITRQELGEYLIARYGPEKLLQLLHQRIVADGCGEHGIEVAGAEIEAAVADSVKGLHLNQKSFEQTIRARYRKNLFEWREDVVRPRLLLSKLCRDRVHYSDEDVRKAYESLYGEKVECRMILWPNSEVDKARAAYKLLANSEDAFARAAQQQFTPELCSSGGKLKPFGRHTLAPNLEEAAFKLRPGEVTPLLDAPPQGVVLLKCDKRIPADTTVSLEAVKAKLVEQIVETKLQLEMRAVFDDWIKRANPQVLLARDDDAEPPAAIPPPSQVVGYYNTNVPVTREELGEYLIARHGVEKLELMVNRRILDDACKTRGVKVTREEIDQDMRQDLEKMHVSADIFKKELLSRYGKNLFEWRQDVIKPKLLLTKLAQGRVKCTEDDLHKAFEALYGEKLECRIILWPKDQKQFALRTYAGIRDSEEEFSRVAKSQVSPTLAASGGRLEGGIRRHTLGNEELEREAFKLQPGEITHLIGTPEGEVVLKCDKRDPPDPTVKFADKRAVLTQEVLRKKVQLETQVVFKELRDQARPRLLLKDPSRPTDLVAESQQLLKDVPKPGPGGRLQVPPESAGR
jgi:parvulin-like peptidyl-prolyl isomerase